VMDKAGFKGWTSDSVAQKRLAVIPDGFFVIEHLGTGKIVATTMATHRPTALHPCGGELGWVAADPAHKGRGLGLATCAAVTALFIRRGYRRIYLQTDDWRLPAIKTYLNLGWEPFPYCEGMKERWDMVLKQLKGKS